MYKLKPDNYTKSYISFKEGLSYLGNINKKPVELKRVVTANSYKCDYKKELQQLEFDSFLSKLKNEKKTIPNISTKQLEIQEENEDDVEMIEEEKPQDKTSKSIDDDKFGIVGGITKKLKK